MKYKQPKQKVKEKSYKVEKDWKRNKRNYQIIPSKDWYSSYKGEDLKDIKKWGWDKRTDFMIVRYNPKINYLKPMKAKLKTHKEAQDYLNKLLHKE